MLLGRSIHPEPAGLLGFTVRSIEGETAFVRTRTAEGAGSLGGKEEQGITARTGGRRFETGDSLRWRSFGNESE